MHGIDELERGTDGPLGVVLVRDRRAPQGHHRVADELLDDPTVTLHHLAREIEVAGQQLTDVLGVAALGHRGEADQIGEQDRDEAALGDARFVAGGGRGSGEASCRGFSRLEAAAALPAEAGTGRIRRPARGTRDGEASPALATEFSTWLVRRTAG